MNEKMIELGKKVLESETFIRNKYSGDAKFAIIFGTGLAEKTLNSITPNLEISYSEIPHFSKTNIKSHLGKMVFTTISGVEVILMFGSKSSASTPSSLFRVSVSVCFVELSSPRVSARSDFVLASVCFVEASSDSNSVSLASMPSV